MLYVTKTTELEHLMKALDGEEFVTVDTEFHRESTYWPKLCLVQIAGEETAAIIDALVENIDLSSLFEFLKNGKPLKVFHACRQDVEIFWNLGKAIPSPIIDTQLMAAVCGMGEQVSYGQLVKQIANISIDKSSQFSSWSRRPLSEKQLNYALSDVIHLRQVYRSLDKQVREANRYHWFEGEMTALSDPALYEQSPQHAWRRIKLRSKKPRVIALIFALAEWRERTAQERDVPKGRILKDEALMELANHVPASAKELQNLRAIPKGFANSSLVPSLFQALEKGKKMDVNSLPRELFSDRKSITPSEALVSLLRVLLHHCAEQSGVAGSMLASADDLRSIAIENTPKVPAMQGWRKEIFGDLAMDLKKGQLSISVSDGQLVIGKNKLHQN